MTEPRAVYATDNPWRELENLLPEAQRRQLAELLLLRLDFGWGEVVIVIKDGHIKEYQEVNTIPAIKPIDQTL